MDNRFGQWTVISTDTGDSRKWLCRCDCGTEKIVDKHSLRYGKSHQCHRHGGRPRSTHSKSIYPHEYSAWSSLKGRCANPRNPRYSTYGARGIKVCERWSRFDNFIADMGTRPSGQHSIDRIDNDGPYSPDNCRWATDEEQASNTTRSRTLTYNGQAMILKDWARITGIDADTIAARLDNYGWSVARALSTTARPVMKPLRDMPVCHDGRTLTLQEWSVEVGVPLSVLSRRFRERGLTGASLLAQISVKHQRAWKH